MLILSLILGAELFILDSVTGLIGKIGAPNGCTGYARTLL
jgi:hypothetical protein